MLFVNILLLVFNYFSNFLLDLPNSSCFIKFGDITICKFGDHLRENIDLVLSRLDLSLLFVTYKIVVDILLPEFLLLVAEVLQLFD